jgi:anti-sigma factor RsiW
MNCRRVQKLIPLQAESDLPSGLANRVASHLEWCGRCNRLADEYNESQGWLRSYTPPEFDEATLDDLKRGVMKRVAESNAGPSLLASLKQQWSRRPILALSAGLLIVFGMVAVYRYQARVKVNFNVIAEDVKQTTRGNIEPTPAIGAGEAPGATLKGPRPGRTSLRNVKARNRNQTMASQAIARQLGSQTTGIAEPIAAPAEQTRALPDNANGSQDMLRIEIQTGDPSIRIIWFAPKETHSHQNKPATD